MRQRSFSELLGLAVKRHRERLALSQETLAERADIHRTHVGFIERGERSPSVDVAAKVARALGLTLSELAAEIEREWSPGARGAPPKEVGQGSALIA